MCLPLDKMPFSFSVVNLLFKTVSPIFFDKYPGFILRSGFGAALKKLCLYQSRRMPCTQCRLQDSCPYSYIFETYRPGDREIDFTAENFPHPFVFYPSVREEGLVRSGSDFTLTLTLFGQGIPYLLFYIYAFDLLGDMGLGKSRGRFVLDSVIDHFSEKRLYSSHDKTLRGEPTRKSLADLDGAVGDSLRLEFVAPTKIEQYNRTVERLTADMLIRALLRRASLLAERHHDTKWQLDFRDIIAQFNTKVSSFKSNVHVERYQRYSVRQGQSQPVYAFTGNCEIKGDIQNYIPLIRLGSYMQIGKSTSQGFGKYEINYEL